MNARWAAEPGVAVAELAEVWCRAYDDEPAAAELGLLAFGELAADACGMGRPGMAAEGSAGAGRTSRPGRPADWSRVGAGLDVPELEDAGLD